MAVFDREFFVQCDDESNCRQRITSKEWRDILLAGRDTFIRDATVRRLRAVQIFPGVVEVSIEPKEPAR